MGDIYSELSIIVKLWGDRRVHRAIVTAKQHAERIRDIPPSPALQTPEQQKTLSEAVAFLGKHLEEITALLQEANPDAMKMLREAYEKKSSAWEMMDTLASTATDEFRMLRIQTGPGWIPIGVSWDTQNDAMHAVYQDYQSQKRQINRSSSEFSQLLEQGSLVGAFDLMTPSSLAKKFQTAANAVKESSTRILREKLEEDLGHAESVLGHISTQTDLLEMHLDKGTMQKIKDASSFLQIHGMSIFPETKQPTMRHLFNVAGREEKASLLQTFEMRAKQVKNFRGLVSELESSVTSSFKTMLETRETAVKTKQRQLLQECQNKLAPLLEAFPNDPQLNLVKANLDKMLNVPSSTLNQKITPHEIELPHLQIHLNAYSEDESELIEETELLINESTNQLTQFIESKTTDFAQRNATISDGISTLKADIATQLKQVGQPPLGDRFNAKLETLSKRITELETAVKDAKPNDYAGQSKALKALEGCREEFKTIEGEIHQALQDDLNVARESRVGDLKYLITTYLEASATVSGDDTKAIRSKIKALVTEVSRAHDQSNPVTGWENYHARKEEIQSGFEQRTSTFQDLKSDCNDAWTNAINRENLRKHGDRRMMLGLGLDEKQLTSAQYRVNNPEGRDRAKASVSNRPPASTLHRPQTNTKASDSAPPDGSVAAVRIRARRGGQTPPLPNRQAAQTPPAAPIKPVQPSAKAPTETKRRYDPDRQQTRAINMAKDMSPTKDWAAVENGAAASPVKPENTSAPPRYVIPNEERETLKNRLADNIREKKKMKAAIKQEPPVPAPTAAASTSTTRTSTVNPDQLERARAYLAKRQSQMIKRTPRTEEKEAVKPPSAKLDPNPVPVTRPPSRAIDKASITNSNRTKIQQLRTQAVTQPAAKQQEVSSDTPKKQG